MSKFELHGKTAIVTGGAGGIGTCIAMAYAEAGANVVVASRTQANLDKVAAAIKALGRESLAIATDVCVPEQVDAMVKQVLDTFGRVDILVNNAGGGVPVKAEELTLKVWNDQMTLNLTSAVICTMAVVKPMIAQKSGKIINISSVAGVRFSPGMAPYAAAKAGLISLAKSLAPAWAEHNITVNTLAPGLTATEGIRRWKGALPPEKNADGTPVPPLHTCPDPEHVADLALFLASPASDRITGELMVIRHSREL